MKMMSNQSRELNENVAQEWVQEFVLGFSKFDEAMLLHGIIS